MMDNATNNDTLTTSIETRCHALGIEFSARHARMRCMPHTIHLAALKVWFLLIVCKIYSSLLLFSIAPRRHWRCCKAQVGSIEENIP